ncbi:two-component system, OmpR family, sensor kinase [Haloechinothrix alba]|uniref:histidine kinase n=1 Tax=Haloechinothrix alba TaxID=664784 RepID=A0A238Y1G6_9PSEU|nr:two-component system, OmpR family, sensor kinase [Haloechinothrix alba]
MTSVDVGIGHTNPLPYRLAVPYRWRAGGELVAVGSLTVTTYAIAVLPGIVALHPQGTYLVLTLAAAGGAAAAAVLAHLISQISDSAQEKARLSPLGAGLAMYGIVVVPFNAAQFSSVETIAGLDAGRVVASVTALTLVAVSLRGWESRWSRWWVSLAGWAAVSIGTAVVVERVPPLASLVAGFSWLEAVVLAVSLLLAVALAGHGLYVCNPLRWRAGLGIALIGSAHLLHVPADVRLDHAAYAAPALRLLGVAVVVLALALRAREVVLELRQRRELEARQAEESVHALRENQERAATRDHELRNLVAGLSGASEALDSPEQQDAAAIRELGTAMRAELGRLRSMIDGDHGCDEDRHVDVAAELTRLVLLHRADGAEIRLDAQPELAAAIPRSALAQVITNLLTNCARHAPGAPVQVTARRSGNWVRIAVHDDGPGVPEEASRATFPRGARDPRSGGLGIGLHESAALLHRHGGSLALGPSFALSGALATLHVPAPSGARHDREAPEPHRPAGRRPRTRRDLTGHGSARGRAGRAQLHRLRTGDGSRDSGGTAGRHRASRSRSRRRA